MEVKNYLKVVFIMFMYKTNSTLGSNNYTCEINNEQTRVLFEDFFSNSWWSAMANNNVFILKTLYELMDKRVPQNLEYACVHFAKISENSFALHYYSTDWNDFFEFPIIISFSNKQNNEHEISVVYEWTNDAMCGPRNNSTERINVNTTGYVKLLPMNNTNNWGFIQICLRDINDKVLLQIFLVSRESITYGWVTEDDKFELLDSLSHYMAFTHGMYRQNNLDMCKNIKKHCLGNSSRMVTNKIYIQVIIAVLIYFLY